VNTVKTAVAERAEVDERLLEKARRMIERAYGPLARESMARGLLKEGVTMRPSALCPSQGRDVVDLV